MYSRGRRHLGLLVERRCSGECGRSRGTCNREAQSPLPRETSRLHADYITFGPSHPPPQISRGPYHPVSLTQITCQGVRGRPLKLHPRISLVSSPSRPSDATLWSGIHPSTVTHLVRLSLSPPYESVATMAAQKARRQRAIVGVGKRGNVVPCE